HLAQLHPLGIGPLPVIDELCPAALQLIEILVALRDQLLDHVLRVLFHLDLGALESLVSRRLTVHRFFHVPFVFGHSFPPCSRTSRPRQLSRLNVQSVTNLVCTALPSGRS